MLATVHWILQVSILFHKLSSVTRDISHSGFPSQRLNCKELPLRALLFCLLFLYFIYCGTVDVYVLNYHSSYYNVKLVSWEDYIIYSTPLVLTHCLNFPRAFLLLLGFFLTKTHMKSPASALGLVNPKSLKKDDNVILSQALTNKRSISLSL